MIQPACTLFYGYILIANYPYGVNMLGFKLLRSKLLGIES